MAGHHAVAAIDVGIIERGFANSALEIVWQSAAARRRRSGTSAHARRSSPAAFA
jgi:hypothetical protein